MSALELSNVTRSYERGVTVLNGVSLNVEPGEVVGLLGENGAGKTTLIKIALGMLHPQAGSVRVFGHDPRENPLEVKRRIGYVSEDQVLPPYLSVNEVVDMHRELFPDWDGALSERLLERFEFTGKERIAKLSKGQARRVAVLCAIAHHPELLLLDEPAGGFDPAARREFLETALSALAEDGSAILFSSHHMGDVERIASRVCMLYRGCKVIDEPLDALREQTHLAVLPAGNGTALGDVRAIERCLGARIVGDELRGVFRGSQDEVRAAFGELAGASTPRLCRISLEDLFIELVEGRR